jgi:hypothetical protein
VAKGFGVSPANTPEPSEMPTREELIPNVPRELEACPQWVVWRYEERDGRQTKAPWCAVDQGRRASTTDPGTWGLFEEAVVAEDGDGVAYVVTADDPYCGVDLDHCRDAETGEVARWAQRILADFLSYTEVTPSGDGLRVWVKARKPGRNARKRIDDGGEVEVYDRDRMFTVTGEHVEGLPRTIEERQEELDTLYGRLWPEPDPKPWPVQPVGVDDHELLERMFAAANGEKIRRLFAGDTSDHGGDDSAADLALCGHLAFWTGRDAARMDRIFRMSGLMRRKWDERRRDSTYGADTIEKAIAGTTDVYQGELDAVSRLALPVAAPASEIVVPRAGEQVIVPAAGSTPTTAFAVPSIPFTDFRRFASVNEPGAEPLVGTEDDCLIGVATDAMKYGDGGSGKSTAAVDLAVHGAAGDPWLAFEIPKPFSTGIIENEGNRAFFRKKVARRLAAWEGGEIGTRPMVMEHPWAAFTFADPAHRYGLAASIAAYKLDLIIVGPITTAGMEAAGTLQDVRAFAALTAETRRLSDRRIAFLLLHHEARHGGVSGAWEGVGDTLIHLQAWGRGETRFYIQKARNAPGWHKTTLHLRWEEGNHGGFVVVEKAEIPDEAIEDGIIAFVGEHPGSAWRAVEQGVEGRGERKREIRDRLLEEGLIVNVGSDEDGNTAALNRCLPRRPAHLYLPTHPEVVAFEEQT